MELLGQVNDDYELTNEEIARVCLNPHTGDGKLFKCSYGALLRLAAWNYKLIFMLRDYQEIQESCNKRFGPDGYICAENDFNALMQYHAAVVNMRKDIQCIWTQYRAVLEEPLTVFEQLKVSGWPIDAEKAAAIVDPEKCHHRVEEVA
jgi:hypothetical protein